MAGRWPGHHTFRVITAHPLPRDPRTDTARRESTMTVTAQLPDSAHSGPGQGARDSETERAAAMATVDTILGSLYVDGQGQPDEPTALLWPSLFTDHRMWRHQIGPLREAGWRTLALDPPGHGRSPGPGRGFTMDECAQAAVQVLDAAGVRAP